MQISTASVAALTLVLAISGTAAATQLYPWTDHAPPFDFLFGNDIDSHQQTKETDKGALSGFFYISFTGVVTKDGYKVATHVDCNGSGAACTVGWLLRGRPAQGTLIALPPNDHPRFSVERSEIPQPGAYAHFHWLGAMPALNETTDGYLLELTAVDRFCFIHDGAAAATHHLSCLENKGLPVRPGVDIATHLNIVATVTP